MNYKQQLISELEDLDDATISEVLDFLLFLRIKQLEEREDIADTHKVLANLPTEGTVPWLTLKAEIGL